MNLDVWDQELDDLGADIDGLLDLHAKSQMRHDRGFRLCRVDIMQMQITLDQRLAQLRTLIDREHLLLPRDRALLVGARSFLGLMEEYAALRRDVGNRMLWVNLLRSRLLGTADEADELSSEDLLQLAVRRSNLARTEAYLESRLVDLDALRRQLTERYKQLDYEEANRVAGMTLGTRLAPTAAGAMANPLVTGLGHLLLVLSRAVRRGPMVAAPMDNIGSRLGLKVRGLMTLCRNIILAQPGARAEDVKAADRRQLGTLMDQQLRGLESLIDGVEARVKPKAPPPAVEVPIHVQREPKGSRKNGR